MVVEFHQWMPVKRDTTAFWEGRHKVTHQPRQRKYLVDKRVDGLHARKRLPGPTLWAKGKGRWERREDDFPFANGDRVMVFVSVPAGWQDTMISAVHWPERTGLICRLALSWFVYKPVNSNVGWESSLYVQLLPLLSALRVEWHVWTQQKQEMGLLNLHLSLQTCLCIINRISHNRRIL